MVPVWVSKIETVDVATRCVQLAVPSAKQRATSCGLVSRFRQHTNVSDVASGQTVAKHAVQLLLTDAVRVHVCSCL